MNLMLPESGLLFWMTIIFAIVFFILSKFGFPIITGMVERRNKRISDSLEAARAAEEALADLRQQQEKIISQARSQQAAILQEAAAERDRMMTKAQNEAREEAQKILDEAKLRIQEEKDAVLNDIRREVSLISLSIAEKVVKKELSSASGQKDYIDRVVSEMSDIS